MRPLPPQLCTGRVFHRRLHPTVHEFVYPVSYVLFDPDNPAELTNGHRLWSTGRRTPVQLRSEDYGGDESTAGRLSLAAEARRQLNDVVSVSSGAASPRPDRDVAPVRLLTQPRRWGWLFNPISVFFVWSGISPSFPPDSETMEVPIGVILEVTNTPWKERHRYPVALTGTPDVPSDTSVETGVLTAEFDKTLHVSPFLDEDFTYRLVVNWDEHQLDDREPQRRLRVGIDAVDLDGRPVVETALDLTLAEATGGRLGRSVVRDGFPTHRTSFGIHRQALSLARKRVPFVAHPRSRKDGQ